jgi:pSer/pThr/pTyr-binding forkhead associated (FHA) protein
MAAVRLVRLFRLPSGDGSGSEFATVTVDRYPFVVGRHPGCDFLLRHPMVSRWHCRLTLWDDQVWIEDLGSLNGTRLNGELVIGAVSLADGDRLDLAEVTLVVGLCEDSGWLSADDDRTVAEAQEQSDHTFVERPGSLLLH